MKDQQRKSEYTRLDMQHIALSYSTNLSLSLSLHAVQQKEKEKNDNNKQKDWSSQLIRQSGELRKRVHAKHLNK